jgi:hypothetical protein
MNEHLFVASFEAEDDVLAAVRAAREHKYTVQDVLTPYAVHGLDEAMGLRQSRLSWVCLAFAVIGVSFAFWLQHWTSAVDWPINVGGKPLNSLPAFVPVAFEVAVLFAGLGTVAALFVRCRMFPGRTPLLSDLRATDERFVLLVAQIDATFEPSSACQLFGRHNAVWCGEIIDGHLHRLSEEPQTSLHEDRESDHPAGRPADATIESAASGRRRRRRVRPVTGAVRE